KYFRKDCFPELSLREALAWLLAVAESSPELMRSLGAPEGLDACRDVLAGGTVPAPEQRAREAAGLRPWAACGEG
ncbi:unnamed protein product, partial [Effrenium voratum]